jgi:hypothetical protein
MYMPNPSTPKPPKKTRRNTPGPFTEALAAPAPVLPAVSRIPAISSLDQTRLRRFMIAFWVLASIAAGIGLGLLLSPERQTGVIVSGWPIASQTLAASTMATTAEVAVPIAQATSADLTVQPGVSITQAEAGTPVSSLALTTYQPALLALALQPDYLPIAFPQGTVGTTPVR